MPQESAIVASSMSRPIAPASVAQTGQPRSIKTLDSVVEDAMPTRT